MIKVSGKLLRQFVSRYAVVVKQVRARKKVDIEKVIAGVEVVVENPASDGLVLERDGWLLWSQSTAGLVDVDGALTFFQGWT